MIEPLKLFSKLWDAINPQKNLDEHYDKLTKAKMSQKRRENLFVAITWAKIIYGIWILLLLNQIVLILGNYFSKP